MKKMTNMLAANQKYLSDLEDQQCNCLRYLIACQEYKRRTSGRKRVRERYLNGAYMVARSQRNSDSNDGARASKRRKIVVCDDQRERGVPSIVISSLCHNID